MRAIHLSWLFWLLTLGLCSKLTLSYAESENLPPVIDNSSYYNGAAAGKAPIARVPAAPDSTALYEVLGQLEQLQKQVREINGALEEQAHELATLKKRQTTLYNDLEQRLTAVETAQKAASITPTPEVTVTSIVEATPSPTATPTLLSTPTALVEPTITPTPSAPATPTATLPPTSATEKNQYQQAYDALREGQHATAIEQLKAFLHQYPNSEYAANAHYWLGEAYKVTQNAVAAREAFNQVVNTYPNNAKAPDALLKLGYLELEQNNVAKARNYFERINAQYASSPAAELAAQKLAALNGQ